MQLYSEQPFWLMKNGLISSYNSLDRDIKTDIAIMGAGISGALMAYYLRNVGLSVTVLERRHVGIGSTAASTAFLQYEIDTPLAELSDKIGAEKAVRSYKLCREAIYTIAKICKSLTPDFDFHLRPSLQYASYKKDRNDLAKEFALRRKNGFEIDWLESEDLVAKFGLDAPAGILSADGGEVDAYMLTHALLRTVHRRGHAIYTNTDTADIQHGKLIKLTTDKGYTVRAKKLVIACGYESLKYLPHKVADVHSTYAFVSEPLSIKSAWHRDSLIWETADPYMYFRKVDGDRILVGGRDDPFHHTRILPSVIKQKAIRLEQAFHKRMPALPVKFDYCWGGPFVVTKDGLPFIDHMPGRKNVFMALGYGGNGITFSVIAAEIISDLITESKNKNAELFRFNR